MKNTVKNKLAVIFPLSLLTETLSACPLCRAQAAAGIYNSYFGAHFFLMLLPILILAAIGIGLYYVDDLRGKAGGG